MTPVQELELLRVVGYLPDLDDHVAFAVDPAGDLPPEEDVADIMAELARQAREGGR